MKCTVRFGTTVSASTATFDTMKEGRAEARKFVKDYLTPGAKRAGEKYRALDKNTFGLLRASGGYCVIATVEENKKTPAKIKAC